MNMRLKGWIRLLRKVPYFGAGVLFVHRPEGGPLEVFMAKRRINPNRGCWSIVGGKRELKDSDFFATACREASEETCGGIPLQRYLASYLATPVCSNKLTKRCCYWGIYNWVTYIVLLHAKPPASEWPVRSAEFCYEFSDGGWFAIDDLPKPIHQDMPKLIKLAQAL